MSRNEIVVLSAAVVAIRVQYSDLSKHRLKRVVQIDDVDSIEDGVAR